MRGRFLLGWARDPERPEERLELEVVLDGIPLGRHRADLERKDLIRAGIGDGHHAFRVELPELLAPGSEHLLTVRATDDGTEIPLATDYFGETSGGAATPVILRTDVVELSDGAASDEPAVVIDPLAALDGGPLDQLEIEELSGTQPERPRGLVGVSGWLFAFESRAALAKVLGQRRPSPERVAEQVRTLRDRHDRLSGLGVGYLVVTVPDKSAVYAEHLPPPLAVTADRRPGAELRAGLREENELETLDLLPALRDARRHGRVFLRRGASPTWTGAFAAYRAIAKEVAKRWPAATPPGAFELTLGSPVAPPDLLATRERVTLLGHELIAVQPGGEDPETEPDLVRDGLEAMYVPLSDDLAAGLSGDATLLELGPGTHRPIAVVLHDGSAQRFVPFMAEHFARTIVEVADDPPYAVIERERPLVVIQVLSEAGSFFE